MLHFPKTLGKISVVHNNYVCSKLLLLNSSACVISQKEDKRLVLHLTTEKENILNCSIFVLFVLFWHTWCCLFETHLFEFTASRWLFKTICICYFEPILFLDFFLNQIFWNFTNYVDDHIALFRASIFLGFFWFLRESMTLRTAA